MRTRFAQALLLLGSIGLVSAPARSNLRAPQILWQPPSGALQGHAAGLTVLGEALRFDCREDRCDVEAVYRIQAERPAEVSLEFILPVSASVQVRVGADEVAAQTEPAEPWPPEATPRPPGLYAEKLALYRARFQGRFGAGANRVEVRYVQPLGRHEKDYGYFKKGRWLQFFAYELWPLKEWALSEDFALELSVSMPREASSGEWRLRKARSIECSLSGASVARQGERLVYTARLGRTFPDRLMCYLGDEDLLPRQR
jgi:hypothetical protein